MYVYSDFFFFNNKYKHKSELELNKNEFPAGLKAFSFIKIVYFNLKKKKKVLLRLFLRTKMIFFLMKKCLCHLVNTTKMYEKKIVVLVILFQV